MPLRAMDFESIAYTNSATAAGRFRTGTSLRGGRPSGGGPVQPGHSAVRGSPVGPPPESAPIGRSSSTYQFCLNPIAVATVIAA
jgi:hypothetical protein